MSSYRKVYERAIARVLREHVEEGVPPDVDVWAKLQKRLGEREEMGEPVREPGRFEWLLGAASPSSQSETSTRLHGTHNVIRGLAGSLAILMLGVITILAISGLSQRPKPEDAPPMPSLPPTGDSTLVFSTTVSNEDRVITPLRGFDIAADGTFWIGDDREQLLHFSRTGELLETIALGSRIEFLIDLRIQDSTIWVLGQPGPFMLYKVALDGNVKAEYRAIDLVPDLYIGPTWRPLKLSLGGDGQILIEDPPYPRDNSSIYLSPPPPYAEIINSKGLPTEPDDSYPHGQVFLEGYPSRGMYYRMGNESSVIEAGEITITISLPATVSGWRMLRVMPDNSFFVVAKSTTINWTAIPRGIYYYVLHYSADGELIERARVPSSVDYYTLYWIDLALGPDGIPYAIVCCGFIPGMPPQRSVDILRLTLYPASEPLPPIPTATPRPNTQTPVPTVFLPPNIYSIPSQQAEPISTPLP